jgi:hypothetical protein
MLRSCKSLKSKLSKRELPCPTSRNWTFKQLKKADGSDFNTYGTVGYTLEQKRDVLMRVLV